MDSNSTGCTLSESAVQRLLQHNRDMRQYSADDVVIIGCGGHQVTPLATCDVEVEVYDCKIIILMFVVPGQTPGPPPLTPVVMKCFEKLVRSHIKTFITPGSDPYQFAYRANRLTEDAVNTALHTALTHLGNYARLLFVDYNSAFNTILPHGLVRKLLNLGLPHSTYLD